MLRPKASALRSGFGNGVLETVIVAKVVEPDVLHWIVAFLRNQLHDTVSSAVDRVVLELHDCTSSQRSLIAQVSCKARDTRNHNDDFVLLACAGSPEDTLDNCSANLVLHRFLLITRCCDEELIFNVDKVFAVADNLRIRILNRMLGGRAIAPFAATTNNLARHVSALLRAS